MRVPIPFLAAIISAATWPFLGSWRILAAGGAGYIVAPSQNILRTSSRLGQLEEFRFTITNTSYAQLELALMGRSCGCIDVTIEPSILSSGEAAEVSVRASVPYSGQSAGTVVIEARQEGDGGNSPARGHSQIPLEFVLSAKHGDSLVVAPATVSVGAIKGRSLALSLAVPAGYTPVGVFVRSCGEEVGYVSVTDWTLTNEGLAWMIASLKGDDIPAGCSSITAEVALAGGSRLSAEVSITTP